MTDGEGQHNGTLRGIKYFETEKGADTGRFCRANEVTKSERTAQSKFPFQMGHTVQCTKSDINCQGTVKFLGCPSWDESDRVHYGLELTEQKGTCDGTKGGVRYFVAKKGHGIYVLPEDVAPGHVLSINLQARVRV